MALCQPTQSYLSFFFTVTATTELYTLSLHDALPIFAPQVRARHGHARERDLEPAPRRRAPRSRLDGRDRKSTRLNSSHMSISYAVFCLKKKKRTGRNHFSPEFSSRSCPASRWRSASR